MSKFTSQALDHTFILMESRLKSNSSPPVRLLICGGSALIALHLVSRTTTDVDILAIVDSRDNLISPAPMPAYLSKAADEVALLSGLPLNWLNNGPSSDLGGLFQEGLPEGILKRAQKKQYGSHLDLFFIGRIDQIFLKVYASVDRLGVHVDQLERAGRWCMTHDPSEPFKMLLKSMFIQLGYGDAARKL